MYNPPDIQGWMSEDELQWLYEQAQRFTRIVEIGCWKGRSTHALLSGCKGTVFAIDHFKGNPSEIETAHSEAKTVDIHQEFLKNVGHFKNLITLKMDSLDAVKMFKDKSVDMVFIDGEHTVQAFFDDYSLWRPKCKTLFCGHDVQMEGPCMFFKSTGFQHTTKGTIWIIED
jgi:predicted O-methyltransferase YrrM